MSLPICVAPEEDVTIRDAELDLADTLMETLGDLDWTELHDEYRAAVEQLVTAKMEGVDTAAAGEEAAAPGKGQVVDLMSVLESSVQAARKSRGESAAETPDATVHELSRQRGAKSTGGRGKTGTAKKAPSKTAAKKTAASNKTATSKKAAASGKAPATKKAAAKAPAGTAAKTAGKSAAKKTAAPKKSQAAAGKTAGTKKTAAKTAKTPAKKTARTRKSA